MENPPAGAKETSLLMASSDIDMAAKVEPVPRKRSGRPAVGGRAEAWTPLLKTILEEQQVKTKNGLPGVPYTLSKQLGCLKNVWHAYVPGADREAGPSDFRWLATSVDAIVDGILCDSYCPVKDAYLEALAATCDMFGKRGCMEHIAEDAAPPALFTPAVAKTYRDAAALNTHRPYHASYTYLKNGIDLAGLVTLVKRVREMRADLTASPDSLRVLGWADVVLSMLVVTEEGGRALLAAYRPDFVDALLMAGSPEEAKAAVGQYSITCAGTLYTPAGREFELDPASKQAVAWAWTQRADAVGGRKPHRLLPRRLTVNAVLRKLCLGPLKPVLGGRVLTLALVQTSLASAMFKDALAAMEATMARYSAPDTVDPNVILSAGVYPSSSARLPALVLPPLRADSAEQLVAE